MFKYLLKHYGNLRMGAFVIDCLHTAGAINNVWIFPGYWMKFFKA